MDIGAPALSNHRQKTSLEDLSLLPPDGPGAHAMNWDVINDGILGIGDIDEQPSSLAHGSEGLGWTSSDFLDHIMEYDPFLDGLEFTSDNEEEMVEHLQPGKDSVSPARKRIMYDVEGIPDLPLQDDHYDYPNNVGDFHNDMPRITDHPEYHNHKKPKRARNANEMKSDVTKYLADKLAKKLNVSSVEVPWSKMKAQDIINWPSDVEFISFSKLKEDELKCLHQLVEEDRLDFSPEFLSKYKITSNRFRYGNELRSNITNYLGNKLAKKLNVSSVKLPWLKMKAEDIINWPSDLEFIPIYKMKLHGLERLSKLMEEDLLDFHPDFLDGFKIGRSKIRESKYLKTTRYGNELRSLVAKYFSDKLAKKLNLPIVKVPWSKMKVEDIINWPSDIKFVSLKQMTTGELKRLHELTNEDGLDFSPEFIRGLILSKSRYKQRIHPVNVLKSTVTNYLEDKLAKKLNVSSIKVPWAKMKAEDIINWPSDLEFMPVYNMTKDALKRLNKLANEDQLDFSPDFLNQWAKSGSEIIKDIETALCNKLNAGTNKNFRWVPWRILKKADVINWPERIPFIRLSRHKKEDLKLLHKLREAISFSNEFLKTLSDPSFDKTPIGQHIIQRNSGAIKPDYKASI